ncbi:MAG: 3-oxoacyl-[acyl-carrier-protein] reductase FabG [Alphaproteobacteria bacterium MarineAlpha9_Bin4]|nr:short-chain dehydrogenase [Pelagibacterales bacterium]PPR26229.1 MAG: 3-oxoacyl-[acyl-carrier-protein] reductase FabG [Alphaproteobacteria bacterium MarineAlpha9_Bin4]|tara:strand:- start:3964 stop:4749 length:786 start_codon:yes stop_codon:yes gene_type:complete
MIENKTYANKKGFNPLNSICVVTGGSSGIGLAIIEELKKRKAKKIINIDILRRDQDNVDFYKCDVGEDKEIKEVFEEIIKKYNTIDLICSNAGIARDDDGLATVEHWNNIWKTNVLQHTNIVRNSIKKMLLKKNGWFLITASAAGLLSQVGSATYSTTKHATVGFAEWLSITYGDLGIGVSVLCPQGVNTPMTAKIEKGGVAGINGMLEANQVAVIALDQMVLGKFLITPHEIVKKYIKIKADDTDKWIIGMRKLYKQFIK